MSRRNPQRCTDYLRHVLEAIDNIQTYTAGMDLATFIADRKTCDAVIRNIEVIGEACNNVVKHHPAFAAMNATIPWGLHTKCATLLRTATSMWASLSYGRPSRAIYPG